MDLQRSKTDNDTSSLTSRRSDVAQGHTVTELTRCPEKHSEHFIVSFTARSYSLLPVAKHMHMKRQFHTVAAAATGSFAHISALLKKKKKKTVSLNMPKHLAYDVHKPHRTQSAYQFISHLMAYFKL